MYLLIVYDIKAKRVNKVKNFLRQNLFWVQNSVFEGEVSEKEYNFIKNSLYNLIDENEDSIIIYNIRIPDLINREALGIEKAPITNII